MNICTKGLPLAGVLLLVMSPAAHAVNLHVSDFGGSDPFLISDVSGFLTTGADMAGMQVTVHLFDSNDNPAGSETVTWVATGPDSGHAEGAIGWRLSQSGDTFDDGGRWTLENFSPNNYGITRIDIVGFDDPGVGMAATVGTVFDRTEPFFGTDGSFRGRDFEIAESEGPWQDIDVRYYGVVESEAHGGPAVRDLFREMRFMFGQVVETSPGNAPIFLPIPFRRAGVLEFWQDTDTIGLFNPDFPRTDEHVPEPTSCALLMLGAAMLGVRRRRSVHWR